MNHHALALLLVNSERGERKNFSLIKILSSLISILNSGLTLSHRLHYPFFSLLKILPMCASRLVSLWVLISGSSLISILCLQSEFGIPPPGLRLRPFSSKSIFSVHFLSPASLTPDYPNILIQHFTWFITCSISINSEFTSLNIRRYSNTSLMIQK
jgi:hypothetical protein